MKLCVLLLCGFVLGGCTLSTRPLVRTKVAEVADEPAATYVRSQVIEQEILEADAELKADVAETKDRSSADRPRIPLEINEQVQKWIHFFTVTDRERFHSFLKRGSIYKDLIQDILKKNGVPRELYYLAMIESGFVIHAKSRARAVGPWQFIKGTGLRYGLKQDRYVDERRDIVRATEAAANYLKGLYAAFQSWYLAMASYNAGEGRILGAVVRGQSRDFWELVERKALPPETRNYVPKFLAAAIIGRHPEKYGFSDIQDKPFPETEAAVVPGGVKLTSIAHKAGIPLKTLKQLNPHLLRATTPASLKTYSIWVPEGHGEKIAQLRLERTVPMRTIAKQRYARVVHRVRKGEALLMLSRRYRVPVSKLKRVNRLRTNRIFAGQRLIIPKQI